MALYDVSNCHDFPYTLHGYRCTLLISERKDSPKIIYVYPETYKEDRQLLLELKKNMIQHAKETQEQDGRISTLEKNLFDRLIPIEEASRKKVKFGNGDNNG